METKSGTCENCNVAAEDFGEGHSFRETERGIEYDVEHLNDLGKVEENGVYFLFDRMHNRLVVERRLTEEEIDERTEIARDRLIAEMWKRGYADRITTDTTLERWRQTIETISDSEDRNVLLELHEDMMAKINEYSFSKSIDYFGP